MKQLQHELTEAFIYYQYRVEHPMPSTKETPETMIDLYRTDRMFKNKVMSLTCGVLEILDKYLKSKGFTP